MKTPSRSIFRFPLSSLSSLFSRFILHPSSFILFFAFLLSASAVDTTTTVWNGTNSNVWSLNTNWAGSVLPSTAASALFNGTFSNQPTLTANQTTQGIWLATGAAQDVTINSAAAQVLTITGNATLNSQLNAGIYMNDSANHNLTIGPNTSITLNGTTGFYNQQAAGTLTFSGGLNLNAKALTIGAGATSTGNVTINSVISGTTGTITVNSAGTVTLSGANTYTGNTLITAGTLTLTNNLALQNSAVDTTGAGTIALSSTNTPSLGGLIGSKNLASVITSGASGVTSLTLNPTVASAYNTYSGVIANLGSGAMSLTKNGTGTQVLSGANTYNGTTTVNAGTLVFGNTGAKSSGNVTVPGAGSIGLGVGAVSGDYSDANVAALFNTNSLAGFRLDASSGVAIDTSAGNFTQSTALTGTRTLTKLGSNTLTLSGNNSYSGTTTVSAGTLALGGKNSSAGTTSVSGGTLQLANTTANNGGLASGSLTLAGNAILQVTNASALTITNAVTLSSNPTNTAIVSGSQSLTINGSFTNAAGSRMLTNNMTTGSTLTLAGPVYLSESGALVPRTLTLSGTGSTVINGAIADFNGTGLAGSLTTAGNGTITLNGTNTYTGATTIGAGTVILSGTNNSTGTTTVGAGGTLQLANTTANNGGLASGLLSFSGNGTLQVTSADPLTISNAVQMTNTVGGVISGNQSLTINGTYTNLGVRSLTNNIAAGKTLTLEGSVYISDSAVTARTMNLSGNGSTVINGAIADFNGTGLAGGLTTAVNTITLNGNNTYTGVTTINAGTVILNGTSRSSSIIVNSAGAVFTENSGGVIASGSLSVGTGTIATLAGNNTYAGGTTISSGSSATLNINSATAIGTGNLTINGGKIDNTSGAALTLTNNNVQAWNGDFAFTGAKDLNLGTGAVTMNASRTVTVNGSNLTVGGNVTGSTFGLTKAGAGMLTLAGNNTYTGATTVSVGTLQFAKQTALYGNNTASWTAANIIVNSGAILALNVGGSGEFASGDVDIIKALGGASTGFKSGSILGLDTTNASGGTFAYNTAIANTNAGANVVGLKKLGANTLELTAANTYTGATTIGAGTLSVGTINNGGTAGNLGNATSSASNIVFDGGTLQYTGANATSNRAFTINAGKTATIDTANNISLAGATGAATNGALTKTGTGVLTLTGTNTYTGNTTVSAGTLAVTGNLTATTHVTVTGGSLLIGATNAINTAATVTMGGGTIKLDGGTTQQFGALTLSANSTLDFGTTGTQFVFENSSGLWASNTLTINNWNPATTTLRFGTDSSGLSQTQLDHITFTNIGTGASINDSGFVIVAVPEPGTILAGALLLGGLAWAERRRLKKCLLRKPW